MHFPPGLAATPPSGLIASHDDVDLAAGGMLATNNATLVAPTVSLGADRIDLEKTWVVPEQSGSISAADVTLGEGTAFNPYVPVAVVTTGLTLGTLIDDKAYPALSLVYSDLALTSTGGLIRDILDLSGLGHVSDQTPLIGRKGVTIKPVSFRMRLPVYTRRRNRHRALRHAYRYGSEFDGSTLEMC